MRRVFPISYPRHWKPGHCRRSQSRWEWFQIFRSPPTRPPGVKGRSLWWWSLIIVLFARLFSCKSLSLLGEKIFQICSFSSASVSARKLIFYLLWISHWNTAVSFSAKSILKDTLLHRWSPDASLAQTLSACPISSLSAMDPQHSTQPSLEKWCPSPCHCFHFLLNTQLLPHPLRFVILGFTTVSQAVF